MNRDPDAQDLVAYSPQLLALPHGSKVERTYVWGTTWHESHRLSLIQVDVEMAAGLQQPDRNDEILDARGGS